MEALAASYQQLVNGGLAGRVPAVGEAKPQQLGLNIG